MFKWLRSKRARLYLGVVSWLLVAYLLVSLRYASQIGTAVTMDMKATSLTDKMLRSTDASVAREPSTRSHSNRRERDSPLYLFVLLSLSDQEVQHPIASEQGMLPGVIHFYEIRTVAGADLPGYAVSVVWKKLSPNSFQLPAPFFRLSTASVNTSSRKISLIASTYRHGDVFAANVGLLSPFGEFGIRGMFSPRSVEFAGWPPSLLRSVHRIDASVPRTQKTYRWGVFSPPPVFGYICFGRAGVKSFALYRDKEEAQKAVLRLWDTEGHTEVVQPERHSP